MKKSVAHFATKAIHGVKMKEFRSTGYLIILILILLLSFPAYGIAARVTQTGSGITIQSSSQNGSQSVTVPADATLCVVMASMFENATNWITANPVTLNGVNLTTLQRTDDQSVNDHAWIGYLVNPSTGSQTLAWNWGTTPDQGAIIYVVFYKGVDTSNPVVSSGKQTTNGQDLTGLTAGVGDMMVGIVSTDTSVTSVTDQGGTELARTSSAFNNIHAGVASKLGGTGFYFTGGTYTACAAGVFRGTGASVNQFTYSNTNSITIRDNNTASPYPSSITVPSVSGTVTKVTVTITGLSHTYPDDIRMLLVGPTGQTCYFMGEKGGDPDVSGVNLTFDDGAGSELPEDTQITSGTYRPSPTYTQYDFPSPAPATPYGTTLYGYSEKDPAGTWSLYVWDYSGSDSGSISGGWQLTLTVVSDTTALLTFRSKYVVTSSTPVNSSSTTLADDTPASQTFSLSASQTVLVIYNPFNNEGSTEIATGKQIAINVDGTDRANTWNSPYAANGTNGATTFWVGTLAAGSHTIKGRFASNSNGSTVTIDERVLLILILDGDAYWYIDDATAQTTTSASLVNDPNSTQAFFAIGACKALILYNVGNANGSTEDQNGKYAAINLGGSDYSQLIKSPNLQDRSDNVFTLHYAALTAGSYTAQGRFASRFATYTVTISRRQLGVLLFADTTLADYVTSDASVNTTSLYPVNDTAALINRTTTDARELLAIATATEDYQTSSRPGVTYGIQVDGSDRTKSRTSPRNISQNSNNSSTAWAAMLAAGAHTVQGRYGNNTGSTAVYVTSRRIAALWLSTGLFQYKRQITINARSCSETLSNFPVLISLSGSWLRTRANDPTNGRIENANGYDIIFRDGSNNQLDHEIEKYDGGASAGTLVAWVRVPTLPQAGTTIYMYYGNSGIQSSTANPTGVWNSNFKGVWHLTEDAAGTGTIGLYKDSTSNGNHGDDYASATGKGGKIGSGQQFDGTDDYINCGNKSNLDVPYITVEFWLNLTSWVADGGILAKGDDTYRQYWLWTYPSGVSFEIDEGTLQNNALNPSLGQWEHLVLTYDGSNVITYRNGTQENIYPQTTGPIDATTQPLFFGYLPSYYYYSGYLDEVRISDVARSACWIETCYGNQNNPGGFITLGGEGGAAPTAVKLTSFTATQYSDGVSLKWKTGYEVDNLGFHIYREENGQLVRLTPEPVAGSALIAGARTELTAGHHYHWWDASLKGWGDGEIRRWGDKSAIRYWLKDIDLSGKETMHGPVTPVISREPIPDKQRPDLLSERGMRLQERYRDFWRIQDLKEKLALRRLEVRGAPRGRGLRTGNKVPLRSGPTGLEGKGFHRQSDSSANEVQRYLASKSAVKIPVKEEGWYRVTQPELLAVGLSSKVNPKYLQLYTEGQEQPIRLVGKKDGVFGPRDAIEFYGVGLDTPSTDTRVYWLIEGTQPGKRIDNHIFNPSFRNPHSAIRNSFASFPYTVEKKDRTLYFPTFKNGDLENFFGSMIYQSRVDQLLEVWHPDPSSPGDAWLEVSLLGATAGPHHVKVLFNNDEVGEIVFEGQSLGMLKVEVSHSEIREGENLVSLIPEGGEMDLSLLDTLRLTYWHTYRAEDNRLRFTASGGEHLTLSGFSQSRIRVFDITEPDDPMEGIGKVESQERGYRISFRVPGHGERALLAITEEHLKNPEGVVSNHPSSWHQGRDGHDLVIITHRDFLNSLQPLKTLRESQGLKVALIDVEDIYDEFSFGNKSPKAIKDFLTLAKANWRRVPRYVLLVGDASFDPRNYLGYGELDFVPTKLVDTTQLETASDDWFVDLNNDGLPDIAIGRLPVQTVEEAAIVVSKIVGYEKSRRVNEALLVADKSEGSNDFNFEGASEEVRALLPSSLIVRKINRGDFSSDGQAKQELLNGINQGPLLVDYIGHGSVEVWRGNLFSSDDAEGLVNAYRLPFFVSMTCLNGFFQAPYADTLAEALLKAKGGGAVAVWASSGLTEPNRQAVMNKELIKLLFNGESLTLGEATKRAKASVSDQDIRKTWILFGDPTTRLK